MSIDAGVARIAPYSGAESGCHAVPLTSRSIGTARSFAPCIVVPGILIDGLGAVVMPGIGAITGAGAGDGFAGGGVLF
jgi:hypothetical protein